MPVMLTLTKSSIKKHNKKSMKRHILVLTLMLLGFVSGRCADSHDRDTLIEVDGWGTVRIHDDHTWQKMADSAAAATCDSVLLRKYVGSSGFGDASLTGARNIRTVLIGALYRGGANNVYNNYLSRNNDNPMNLQGVINMSSAGFKNMIYLYGRNFKYYYPEQTRNLLKSQGISYESIVPSNDSIMHILLSKVRNAITDPQHGPVYVHCWNGWHMSGIVSAFALMQFCDISNRKALAYWEKGTDGHFKGFDKIRQRILGFKKFEDLAIPIQDKLRICPCMGE